MKINIYGSSLAAWVAAACLAKVGNDVVICDVSEGADQELRKISVIRDELGLLDELTLQINEGRLARVQHVNAEAGVHWLALQSNEQKLAAQVINSLQKAECLYALVVSQCNFSVGATADLQSQLGGSGDVVYIPDNLQEGRALEGFNKPKSLILGFDNDSALTRVKALLRPFSSNLEGLQIMSSREAEFTKFAITGMLAIRLGYVNELANLADQLGVDIGVVQDGMGADPRIGRHYLSPGCGFGGQNFHAYVSRFSGILQKERQQSLLKTIVEENEVQKELLFRKLWQYYKGDLAGKTVGIWGVSFKPGTASIDNAPSLKIIDALISQGVKVRVHDPEALNNLKAHYAEEALIAYYDDHMELVKGIDALLLVTEWPLYCSPDYEVLVSRMNKPLIVDGRNVFDKEMMSLSGIDYLGVGR
ncbi:MAG: UDP-glucose/GDP-mannose dehydrogenase family protein [Cycloclasticus sp.]|nr:UDP-glucose/GDP-mannose dehydrogenase family protein [Cycloclasticus sp.]